MVYEGYFNKYLRRDVNLYLVEDEIEEQYHKVS
jgi:hypothetical protein